MLEDKKRQYTLAAQLRWLLIAYGDVCDGPTLEALGAATGKAMALAESDVWFDWNSVTIDNLPTEKAPS